MTRAPARSRVPFQLSSECTDDCSAETERDQTTYSRFAQQPPRSPPAVSPALSVANLMTQSREMQEKHPRQTLALLTSISSVPYFPYFPLAFFFGGVVCRTLGAGYSISLTLLSMSF